MFTAKKSPARQGQLGQTVVVLNVLLRVLEESLVTSWTTKKLHVPFLAGEGADGHQYVILFMMMSLLLLLCVDTQYSRTHRFVFVIMASIICALKNYYV